METAAWILSVVGSLWIGSYFSPYLRKRAENLASHDDLQMLIDQVKATTEATRRIEAQISNEVWDRQRQWELKRDILLDALRSVNEFENTLMEFGAVFKTANSPENAQNKSWDLRKNDALVNWANASRQFENARVLGALVSGKDLREAFDVLAASFRDSFPILKKGKDDEEFHDAIEKVQKYSTFVLLMLRIELDIPERPSMIATSLSSESSASPNPGSQVPE